MWVYIFLNLLFVSTTLSKKSIHKDFHEPLLRNVDPEANMTAEEMIVYHGYPLEVYKATTKDGYTLTIQRIPHGIKGNKKKPGEPVLVQHGFLGSSIVWVSNTKDKNLAYILADAGYDVWLGNIRGTVYGAQHKYLTQDNPKFWAFSFHEMAKYDIPTVIDLILKHSRFKKIFYIGHSLGTVISFALLSTQPKYNTIIKGVLAMAPVANTSHITSPIKVLKMLASTPELAKLMGVAKYEPTDEFLKLLSKVVCSSATRIICSNGLFLFSGFNLDQLNETRLPVYINRLPAGTSVQNMVHLGQIMGSGKFQHFDYGSAKNAKIYSKASSNKKKKKEKHGNDEMLHMDFFGATDDVKDRLHKTIQLADTKAVSPELESLVLGPRNEPPIYDVTKITTKMALFWSSNDYFTPEEDLFGLINQLPNVVENYRVPSKSFAHIDFMWGLDAKKLVYKKLLSVMKSM